MSIKKNSSKKSARVTNGTQTPQEDPAKAAKVLEQLNAMKAPAEKPEEAPSKAEKAPSKATPLDKEPKVRKTPEELQAELATARKNYRRTVEFLCTKTHTREVGIVRSARLDKRTDFIQYRIEIIAGDLMGQVYGKGYDSKDLEWLS